MRKLLMYVKLAPLWVKMQISRARRWVSHAIYSHEDWGKDNVELTEWERSLSREDLLSLAWPYRQNVDLLNQLVEEGELDSYEQAVGLAIRVAAGLSPTDRWA